MMKCYYSSLLIFLFCCTDGMFGQVKIEIVKTKNKKELCIEGERILKIVTNSGNNIRKIVSFSNGEFICQVDSTTLDTVNFKNIRSIHFAVRSKRSLRKRQKNVDRVILFASVIYFIFPKIHNPWGNPFTGTITLLGNHMIFNGKKIKLFNNRNRLWELKDR